MLIAGVDEVGRGPLVGDVVAAAVILPKDFDLPGLTDSKKLSEKKRDLLYDAIQAQAVAYAVGRANPQEIDQLNILHASMLAMKRAVDNLLLSDSKLSESDKSSLKVLVDGNRCPKWSYNSEAIVGGDLLEPAISAASIIAKVTRDRECVVLDRHYPQYGFAKHKGYPTKAHLAAIQEHGVLAEHRRSFKPVQKALASAACA